MKPVVRELSLATAAWLWTAFACGAPYWGATVVALLVVLLSRTPR